jgi:hypothetical protein
VGPRRGCGSQFEKRCSQVLFLHLPGWSSPVSTAGFEFVILRIRSQLFNPDVRVLLDFRAGTRGAGAVSTSFRCVAPSALLPNRLVHRGRKIHRAFSSSVFSTLLTKMGQCSGSEITTRRNYVPFRIRTVTVHSSISSSVGFSSPFHLRYICEHNMAVATSGR